MAKFLLLNLKVHEKVHDLKMKKQWSEPKIYHGGDDFDITKDWYVYYSYRNPESGKLERQTNIKRGNEFKSKGKRLEVLNVYKKALKELLEEGFNPFTDNNSIKEENTINDAIDFAMNQKRQTWAKTNYDVMVSRVRVFKEFLKKEKLLNRPTEIFNKKAANKFLDEILSNSSVANRNNYKSGLSSLFTFMVVRDLIQENPFLKIPKLKTKPKGKKVYSKELKQSVIEWMKVYDPVLLQFIQVFTFGMIRPIEAVRLKVKDINLSERYFYVNAKQKSEKKKIISQLLYDSLPDLSEANPNDFVLTKIGVPGKWEIIDQRRREFFSNRFKAMRNVMKFDKELKMYNFRHTIISELYVQLIKEHGKKKAIHLLMEITGHSTEKALMFYLETMDAYLPADFSKYLS